MDDDRVADLGEVVELLGGRVVHVDAAMAAPPGVDVAAELPAPVCVVEPALASVVGDPEIDMRAPAVLGVVAVLVFLALDDGAGVEELHVGVVLGDVEDALRGVVDAVVLAGHDVGLPHELAVDVHALEASFDCTLELEDNTKEYYLTFKDNEIKIGDGYPNIYIEPLDQVKLINKNGEKEKEDANENEKEKENDNENTIQNNNRYYPTKTEGKSHKTLTIVLGIVAGVIALVALGIAIMLFKKSNT